jgi:predicted DNA-binding transcriptional regulator AlpA
MNEKMPPWVDVETLVWATCSTKTSIENYVEQGKLPPPRKLGGKRIWRWAEVEDWLNNGPPSAKLSDLTERVKRELDSDAGHRE